MLKLNKVKKSEGNLLVYILDYTNEKEKAIKQIAEEKNLVPFRVNSDYENYNAELYDRIQPPVEQWVRGFYDAEYVITDSFHACVFAIIFSKPFVVCLNSERGRTRYESLFKIIDVTIEKVNENIYRCFVPNREKIQDLKEKTLKLVKKELNS